jgi:hypothetical protein
MASTVVRLKRREADCAELMKLFAASNEWGSPEFYAASQLVEKLKWSESRVRRALRTLKDRGDIRQAYGGRTPVYGRSVELVPGEPRRSAY